MAAGEGSRAWVRQAAGMLPSAPPDGLDTCFEEQAGTVPAEAGTKSGTTCPSRCGAVHANGLAWRQGAI
ncbi:hypothetical protein AB0N93_25820 [Streptomyces sp. NPDC091267]|uniref:hypothetical protein n=1 Tax=unclassified Streptomyces TaxID=2593676 RepID=UPI00343F931D